MRFNFHAGQEAAWNSEARFTFVLAGTQSGKTSFGPLWLFREIQRNGAGDYLAVTSTYDLFQLKMRPALRRFLEYTLGIARYWGQNRVLELAENLQPGRFLAAQADDPMWGRIILRSADKGGLESATVKAAWLDECGQDRFSLETWEAVLRRLSLSRGRVLGTTTPYNLGWLKAEVHDRFRRVGTPQERPEDRDYRVVQFPSYLNPAFPHKEFQRAQATMPKHRFEMMYLGQMARPAGLIYDCYQDEIGGHLVNDFYIPPDWPRWVGVDFGAVNTALVWLAKRPETGVYYLYRESLEGGKTTAEHCAGVKRLAEGENLVGMWGGAPSETQQRMDWMNEGVSVQQPPVADVESGIDRVTALLKPFKLYVFASCVGVRDEFGTYKRKLDEQGETLEEIERRQKFHRLDALRYVAAGLVGGDVTFGQNIWE